MEELKIYLGAEGDNRKIIDFLSRNKIYGEKWRELYLEHRVDIDAETGLFGANIPVNNFHELQCLIMQLTIPYVKSPGNLDKPKFRLDLGLSFKNEFLTVNIFLQDDLSYETHYKREAQNKEQYKAVIESIKTLERAFISTSDMR